MKGPRVGPEELTLKHRFVVLTSLALVAACGESPTEMPVATAEQAALNATAKHVTESHVFTSGADVTTWDPILPSAAYDEWPQNICTNRPLVGLDANWQNPHNSYVLTGHPWAYDTFFAPWINAWNDLMSLGPEGQSWTKYRTTVSGNGTFVIRLMADNCSWIYLDHTLVGVQGDDRFQNSYGVTLNGTHTLEFIIFDGGGAAGGKFILETTSNPPPPLNEDLDGDGHPNDSDAFPLDPLRWNASNLAANGSFEFPAIKAGNWPLPPMVLPWQTFDVSHQGLSGWTVDANAADTQRGEAGFQFTGVPDGLQVLDLNNGSISQAIATTAGYKYRVSFKLSENYVCAGGSVKVRASFGGTSQEFTFAPGSGESAQNMRWDAESFEAVSSPGSSSTLRFAATQYGSCGGPMLDAVSVEVIGPGDATPPSIVPTIVGPLGANGWYTGDVNVSWNVSDAESAITSTSGCASTSVTTDTNGVTFTCSATSSGGTASESVTIKRDATAPSVTPTVGGTMGLGGWYTSDVLVSWSVSDGTSGIASSVGCSPTTTTADNGGTTYTCTATNGAGLLTTLSVGAKRDATKPVIGYAGNNGTYNVAETVAITCSASDAMSGLASSTCANVNGAAYTFAIGANHFSAAAQDNAGNSNTATASFNVVVTSGSLCTLVERWVSNAGVANSMCVKLRAQSYGAFRNELSAQSGKKISETNAAILLRLVNLLW